MNQPGRARAAATTSHTVGTHPVQAERLAELVTALSGCLPSVAEHAVLRSMPVAPEQTEPLEIVARALVSVRRGIDLRDELDLT